MHKDFDRLIEIVKDVFPAASANKQVYGIDVFNRLESYRSRITGKETSIEFARLLNTAILSCKGSHFWQARISRPIQEFHKDYVEEDAVEINEGYRKTNLLKKEPITLNLPFVYLDGDYYTLFDFSNQDRTYKRGLKVIQCNGKTPEQIIRANIAEFGRWDYERSRFFGESFYQNAGLNEGKALELIFEDEAGGCIKSMFDINAEIDVLRPKRDFSLFQKTVEYFKEPGILYIRIPMMQPNDIPFYEENIKRTGAEKDIDAVVIDIRNNPGGSDLVWHAVLAKLIRKPYEAQIKIGIKNTHLCKEYVARHESGKDIVETGTLTRIPFLDQEEFQVLSETTDIQPHKNSIGFDGNIFVLADNIYSAAGSLTSFAKQFDEFVTVGRRNPYILGMGIDPLAFSLPYSKFIFSIEPVIDLTNCTSAEDVFHTDVEVPVKAEAKEWLEYYNASDCDDLEDFLTRYDPIYKKVLALMREK